MIRKASLQDLDSLLLLEQGFPGDRISRQSFRHLLLRGHADIFVYEQRGRIVANTVLLYRKGFHSARLYSLVVDPVARGQGIATALLGHIEQAALARDCFSLRLELREDNSAARALYEKHGYEVVGRSADYYEDHSTALRMRKQLHGKQGALHLKVPYYSQSLDFTCGPAALMMALRYLKYARRFSQELELQLWREATTVFMLSGHGGCSAHGLGLAALRRGFQVEIWSRDGGVPFLDSVRDAEKKAVIELSHRQFLRDLKAGGANLRQRDFGVEVLERALRKGSIPLLLLSGYRLYGERIPHWCVVTGFDQKYIYLHDPFIPKGLTRADSINLPLAKADFERVSRYGRAQHRYLLLVSPAR